MMKFRTNLFALTALAGAALLLTGCEDPAAKARAEVQEELTSASDAFQTAVLSRTGTLDDAGRSELRSILNRLTSAMSNAHAGAGQKSSASLLAADIHRLLADSKLGAIDELRAQQRDQRLAVYSMISSAERLNTIASALEAGNVDDQLAALSQHRSAAEEALRQEQAQIAQVEPPLAQLETKIGEARSQVNDLRTQENHLRRQASEMGYSSGFSTYEQAIAIRQQADAIETESSYDELSRDFEYQPSRDMHEQRMAQIEAAIEAIDLAVEELRENAASASSLASKTRQDLDAQMQRIAGEVTALGNRLESEIKPAIDDAIQDLSSAASKAKQSAGANLAGGTSARLTGASANSALGQLHAGWAFEQEQHAALLNRLASSNLPGTGGKYSSQVSAAEQAKSQAIEEAVAALTEAASTYAGISGSNASAAQSLRHDVEVTIATLTGQAAPEEPQAMDMPAADPSMAGDMSGSASSTMNSGQSGAESPEALAAALSAMNTGTTSLDRVTYFIPAEQINLPQSVQPLVKAQYSSLNAARSLASACNEQFGAGSADTVMASFFMGLNMTMPPISNASVTSSDGNSATLSISDVNGGTKSATATLVNGRWYLGSADEAPGGEQIEQIEQMASQGSQMIQQLLQRTNLAMQAMNDLAGRVRNGEFANAQAARQAFDQAMMEMAGSMPSGLPGGNR